MNKAILTALAIASISSTKAQISIGPIAGWHFAKYAERYNGKKIVTPQYRLTTNWRLGITANVPLSTHWALQPSAMYATNYAIRPKDVPKNRQVNPNTLDVPLNVMYKPRPNSNSLSLAAGPFVAYHFKTYEITLIDAAGNTLEKLPLFARFNLGLNATVGYEWQAGWFLRGHFQRTLTGMYSDAKPAAAPMPLNATYLTHFSFGLSVGYFFRKHPKNGTDTRTQQQQ